jgi:hypothetical protein
VTAALLIRAAEPPPAKKEAMADALTGVWVHVGVPGKIRPVPPTGATLKFRMSGHWTYTKAHPDTGVVGAHFGGRYRVVGDEYIETVDYSTDEDDSELGKTLKFTVKIEGDLMTQTGVNNPYTEVWKRVR